MNCSRFWTATAVRKGDDAPLRGALESAYRIAVINTFGGGANELQRDIIAMAGLFMPRAPRDLRARNTERGCQMTDTDRIPQEARRAHRPADRRVRQADRCAGPGEPADDSALGLCTRRHEPGLPRPRVRREVEVRRHRVSAGHAAGVDDARPQDRGDRRTRRSSDRNGQEQEPVRRSSKKPDSPASWRPTRSSRSNAIRASATSSR